MWSLVILISCEIVARGNVALIWHLSSLENLDILLYCVFCRDELKNQNELHTFLTLSTRYKRLEFRD